MAIESKMHQPIMRTGFSPENKKEPFLKWIFVIIFVCALIIGGYFGYIKLSQSKMMINTYEGYQAVFVDNGQTYFGKLQKTRGDFYLLTNVFYLSPGSNTSPGSNLALSKLGLEAHGPEDKMEINKDHILFIETMKNDSKVVQAIEAYKNQNK